MVIAHLVSLDSSDVALGELPADPGSCCVMVDAAIGPKGGPGAENFAFSVITHRYVAEHRETRWGRGSLLVHTFSWSEVNRMVERLRAQASAATWHEVAAKLNQELLWEFDNYTPLKEAARPNTSMERTCER